MDCFGRTWGAKDGPRVSSDASMCLVSVSRHTKNDHTAASMSMSNADGDVHDMWCGRTHTVCVGANIVTSDNECNKGRA
eukprot:8958931-Heterocapsa_arctica.AAC.1